MPYTVYEVPNIKGRTKLPAWTRQAMVSDEGEVFLPPAIVDMTEMTALLCAGYDGTPAVVHKDHIYLSTDWLKKEKPKFAELIDGIVERIKK